MTSEVVTSAEPASFRDPTGAVFYAGDRVLRGLDDRATADWEAIAERPFFRDLSVGRKVVRTSRLGDDEVAALGLGGRWSAVLEHERVPFISYPYEWTFSMLKDAALLHLDVLLAALGGGATMKDGTAFNVQWRGTSPVFIDIGSFEPATGGPWPGYRQFCETFLFPLMLEAYRGLPFQPFLRGRVDGVTPEQMARLLRPTDRLRPGALRHVDLQRVLEQRFAAASTERTKDQLSSAGFSTEVALAVARKLRALVARLTSRRQSKASTWSDYGTTCTYDDAARRLKADVVGKAAAARHRRLVADIGCNEGTYSRLAAASADAVVAADLDDVVIDRLYREGRDAGDDKILPLVLNLLDPSPGLGWRGAERAAFADRLHPDLVLALALVHHLAIAGNVPLPEVADWLRSFDAEVVVEFVEAGDSMADRLLANKPAGLFRDYTLDNFDALLGERFDVRARDVVPGTKRTLFTLTPR